MCVVVNNPQAPIVIRSVWANNLDSEFKLIREVVMKYRWFSMDTEFPGVVVKPGADGGNIPLNYAAANYLSLKTNVDQLNLIQIGITITDEHGNLPNLGTDSCYIWEFNFKDFDVEKHAHAHESVELLRRQGTDFAKNSQFGIDSLKFAELMISSGLVLDDEVNWVTFHSAYDFGYLIKILTQQPLAKELSGFLESVRMYFGPNVYDVKHLMKYCESLHGGLDRVSKALKVDRAVGNSHQAGSDSLVTMQVFIKMRDLFFSHGRIKKYVNALYGLEIS